MTPCPSLLIIGPTGTGKTPLGEYLQSQSSPEQSFFHFDFGENLRIAHNSGREAFPALRDRELDYIYKVLNEGALLDDEHFSIAEKILSGFIAKLPEKENRILVLNGLPRHTGQAEGIAPVADVRMVIHLCCTPEIVVKRIELNSGGDRSERTDDSLDFITKKLTIFREQTSPLIAYYAQRDVKIVDVNVAVDTQPGNLFGQIQAALPF